MGMQGQTARGCRTQRRSVERQVAAGAETQRTPESQEDRNCQTGRTPWPASDVHSLKAAGASSPPSPRRSGTTQASTAPPILQGAADDASRGWESPEGCGVRFHRWGQMTRSAGGP